VRGRGENHHTGLGGGPRPAVRDFLGASRSRGAGRVVAFGARRGETPASAPAVAWQRAARSLGWEEHPGVRWRRTRRSIAGPAVSGKPRGCAPGGPARPRRARLARSARIAEECAAMSRASFRLSGRVLFLTEDPALLQQQLDGQDLPAETVRAICRGEGPKLIDNISTDEITPGWVCFLLRRDAR
jgi:hypothetical protein